MTIKNLNEDWLYLAAALNVFSRKVICWATSDKIDTTRVKTALKYGRQSQEPEPGLIHHSNRRVQYASGSYQQILKDLDIVCNLVVKVTAGIMQ